MKFKAGRYNSVFICLLTLRSGVMSLTRKNKKEKVREPRTKITWKEVKRQKVLLFWAAIMVAYGVIFLLSAARWLGNGISGLQTKTWYIPFCICWIGQIQDAVLGYDIYPCYKKYTCNGCYQSGCNFCHSHSICNLTE